jgi:quinolinate synthase
MVTKEVLNQKLRAVPHIGFLDVEVDPAMDLFAEIGRLKKEKNAVILAHYYQEPDIQDIADFVGDSLGLAQQAAKTKADIILFAGVHFMAETAKIICPTKKVIVPDLNAGCSLSDSCPPDKFAAFKMQYPDHQVVTYINCSAGLKALSDVVVTSTNALAIVESFPKDQPLIFAPDKNLGAYVSSKTGRDMVLWDGACMVHEVFSHKKLVELKTRHPEAKVIAHPECQEAILALADYIGSTSGLLKFAGKSDAQTFIVVTEAGILHQMRKANPGKTFIPAQNESTCACNDCPHMKLNTLEKVYISLKHETPEVDVEESIRIQAMKPIERMLQLSAQLGL